MQKIPTGGAQHGDFLSHVSQLERPFLVVDHADTIENAKQVKYARMNRVRYDPLHHLLILGAQSPKPFGLPLQALWRASSGWVEEEVQLALYR